MRWHVTSFVMLAGIALAGAAPPEPPTGSRLGNRLRPGPTLSTRDQAVGAKSLAACLYDRRERDAHAMLLAQNIEVEQKAAKRLSGEVTCHLLPGANDMVEGRQGHFPHEILRGMLAERALERVRPRLASLSPMPFQRNYTRPWFAITGRHPSVDEMGVCIADTNPAAIVALVKTEPTGREEGAAFGALNDDLVKCLQAGTKLQANRQSLRAALADALYQRLMRPAPEVQVATAEAATRQARLVFRNFAECVVKKRADEARTYILDELDEQQTARLRSKMLDDSCWRAAAGPQVPIETTGLKLQGTLAEALLAAEVASGPLREIGTIAPLRHEPVTEAEAQKVDPATLKFMEEMAYLFQLGECVARANVAGSHALLRSEPASAEELTAIGTLMPAFKGCAKAGRALTAGMAEMRAAVAVNYYRLAHAPRRLTTVGASR